MTKKVAQDVSCLRPQDFSTALSLVRKALSEYLMRKKRASPSYRDLCRLYRFNDDALYWMEEVDKEVRKGEELDQLEVDEDSIIYMVFYWTCVALNVSVLTFNCFCSHVDVFLDAQCQTCDYYIRVRSDLTGLSRYRICTRQELSKSQRKH